MDHQSFLSLAEQLQISEFEIASRKRMLGFTNDHVHALVEMRPTVTAIVGPLIEDFYEAQLKVPQIKSKIGDKETLRRLKSALRGYILRLFDGDYGIDYVNSRLRIGKVHAQIGVEPKFYTASLHQLECMLVERLEIGPENRFLEQSLRKLLQFDLQLVFDTYIQGKVHETQLARDQAADYSRDLLKIVDERTQAIRRIAVTDELTGLRNRRALHTDVSRAISTARDERHLLSVLFMDVDDFKQINDTMGHPFGDDVLARIGRQLTSNLRPGDLAYRFGGDEFCVLLPDASEAETSRVASRLKAALRKEFDGKIRMSVGQSSFGPDQLTDFEAFLTEVDRKMYEQKQRKNEIRRVS